MFGERLSRKVQSTPKTNKNGYPFSSPVLIEREHPTVETYEQADAPKDSSATKQRGIFHFDCAQPTCGSLASPAVGHLESSHCRDDLISYADGRLTFSLELSRSTFLCGKDAYSALGRLCFPHTPSQETQCRPRSRLSLFPPFPPFSPLSPQSLNEIAAEIPSAVLLIKWQSAALSGL
jgi:hypothetical protein